MKIKIEKNVPIPNNNPWAFRKDGVPSPWSDGILNTMDVGDSFVLESGGGKSADNKLEMQVRALRSFVHAQKRFKGSTMRISQRKMLLKDGRVAYRIWRVE